MNGTVIDIPGISVNVVPHELMHSTDMAYTITLTDGRGNKATVEIAFGKIIEATADILR